MRRQHLEPVIISGGFLLNAKLCKPKKIKAAVLFIHGMCSDHKELGIFTKLEKQLLRLGCLTLRFDFRGHGESAGNAEDVSIKGEIEDIHKALKILKSYAKGKPIGLIAASFGASISLLGNIVNQGVRTAVFLNPVMNFTQTFLKPKTQWGQTYFGTHRLFSGKPIKIEGCKLSRQFVLDLTRYKPEEKVKQWKIPTFIIHGDHDTVVSHLTSNETSKTYNNFFLATIPGAGHGFDNTQKRKIVIDLTVLWFISKLLGR